MSSATPSKEKVGIGIIGCGVISQFHAQALQTIAEAELVAVADVREDAARQMAEKFSVPTVYTDAQSLIDDPEVDGVILALPAGLRFDPALAAFAAGKHVLTEKPVAINADQVQKLIEAQGDLVGASASGRYLFTETARRARAFLESGALGELRSLRSRGVVSAGPPPTSPPPAWRVSKELNGGGILVNWGCYEIDFLLGLLDWKLQPKHVLAKTFGVPEQLSDRVAAGSDAESQVNALITFEQNVVWTYERAEFYPGPTESLWEITGSKGTLYLKMLQDADEPQVIFYGAPAEGGIQEEVIWPGPDDFDEVHNGPAKDFVRAIREGIEPRTTLKHALITAKLSDAIYRSSESGECVTIS